MGSTEPCGHGQSSCLVGVLQIHRQRKIPAVWPCPPCAVIAIHQLLRGKEHRVQALHLTATAVLTGVRITLFQRQMRVGAATLARQPSVDKSIVRVDLLNLPAHCNQKISSSFSDSSDFLAWLDLIWSSITTKNTDTEPLMLICREQENVMEEEVTDDVHQGVSKERIFHRTLCMKRRMEYGGK